MIYIIYGANGIGKKSVRNHIANNYGLKILDKYTNGLEELDTQKGEYPRFCRDHALRFVPEKTNSQTPMSNENFKKKFEKEGAFIYTRKKTGNSNVLYAIKKKDLSKAIKDSKHDYLLVVSYYRVVQNIKDFLGENNINVIFVAGDIHVNDDANNKPWKKRDAIDTNKKFNGAVSEFAGVILNPTNYDFIARGIKIEQQWESITKIQSLKMRQTAFIVRPFNPKNKDNKAVDKKIKSILKDKGLTDVGIVNPDHKKPVITSIEDGIRKAGLVIVDLRGHKPNCYYELAYARSLGKSVLTIVLESDQSRIAFDTSSYPYFPYKITTKNGIRDVTFCPPVHGQLSFEEEVNAYSKRNRVFSKVK